MEDLFTMHAHAEINRDNKSVEFTSSLPLIREENLIVDSRLTLAADNGIMSFRFDYQDLCLFNKEMADLINGEIEFMTYYDAANLAEMQITTFMNGTYLITATQNLGADFKIAIEIPMTSDDFCKIGLAMRRIVTIAPLF